MKNEFDYLNDVRMDFSLYDEEPLTEKEIRTMKRNVRKNDTKISKRVVIALTAAAVAVTGTAFASGFAENIINCFSTGHNTILQVDNSVPQELPENLQGVFYDADGKPLGAVSSADIDNLYDADGNKIDKNRYAEIIADAFGGEVEISKSGEISVSMPGEDDEVDVHEFASIADAESNASFDVKIPSSLPEGYSLSRIYTYKDGDGNYSGDYVTVEYVNGNDEIMIFERAINDITRFTMDTDEKVEEIDLNGGKAVLIGNDTICWESADGVSVYVAAHGAMTRDELVGFASGIE